MWKSACFTCKDQSSSFLGSSYFEKLMNFELSNEECLEVRFFGKPYAAKSCMWVDLEDLFSEVKKQVFIAKGYKIRSLRYKFRFNTGETFRMDILKVLKFFLTQVQQVSKNKISSSSVNVDKSSSQKRLNIMLMPLLTEIKNFLLFVGPISKAFGISNRSDSYQPENAFNYYHYRHLCLDIWFISLAIVYNICLIMPEHQDCKIVFCNSFDESSPFLQLCSFLIFDLICLSLERYKNVFEFKNLPFPCQCIQDLWIILMCWLSQADSPWKDVSFWSLFHSVIQTIPKNSLSGINNEHPMRVLPVFDVQWPDGNIFEAFLWIISHMAPLCKNFNRLNSISVTPKSGYAVLKYLTHNILSSATEMPEKLLRSVMSYCIPLADLWETNVEFLMPFIDLYFRKIEETFSIQRLEIKISYLFKDSLTWFSYISKLSSSSLIATASSFDHFLQILCMQVKKDFDKSLWRALKGRIYSRYFPKRVVEISEIGLQNSMSLFLAIIASNQFEITDKICEVVSIIDRTALYRKQLIAWKAAFVLLYLYPKQNQNLQKIIALISDLFNAASMEYSKAIPYSQQRTDLMNLLLIYIDNMHEILKRRTDIVLHQLITKGFETILSSCSTSERDKILRVFNDILQNILEIIEREGFSDETHHSKTMEALFNHIYPCVKNKAIVDSPPHVVSDIAITFTKVFFLIPSTFDFLAHDIRDIFMYFGFNENVNCNLSAHYLSSVLECSDIMHEMRLKVENLDKLILQSWLKCTIYIHHKSEYIDSFTKNLFKSNLNIITDFALSHLITDYVQGSIHFYEHIGETYEKSNSQKKAEIAKNVQQVFKSFALYASNKIRKVKASDSFTHVYKLLSHLILNCSIVLHHRVTSDYVLLEILDKTLYPQLLFPKDKELQSQVSNCVKTYLPDILRGLIKLEYRQDKSVEREIRCVIMYYISAFPPSNNPIVKLMVDSVEKKQEGLTVDAYLFILETLKSNFLSNNAENPICIINFFQEIFKLTSVGCKKEIANVLLKCCLDFLMKRNNASSETLTVVLKKTLSYFKENVQKSVTKDILAPVVEWFVEEKLQWSVMRGFSLLYIFVDYVPDLILSMFAFLGTSIQAIEERRGGGEDAVLRLGLNNISSRLQDKYRKPGNPDVILL